jgi:hypothetical protein
MKPAFSAQVLSKYTANYEVCDACGFLRTYEPHWLDEAYSSAIAAADTGLVMRNYSLALKIVCLLYGLFGERGEGRYLDSAGGYGMFTRLMRDFGFDFYWSDKYCQNLLALGFDYKATMGNCNAVTAMEVMEHLTDPVGFVQETLDSADSDTLIFTTELYKGAPPKPDDWWYYTFATGQHIGFFQRRTLETIGKRLGLHFSSANGLHILSRSPVNERLMRVVTNRWTSSLAPWLVRRKLGPKTMADHLIMLKGLS